MCQYLIDKHQKKRKSTITFCNFFFFFACGLQSIARPKHLSCLLVSIYKHRITFLLEMKKKKIAHVFFFSFLFFFSSQFTVLLLCCALVTCSCAAHEWFTSVLRMSENIRAYNSCVCKNKKKKRFKDHVKDLCRARHIHTQSCHTDFSATTDKVRQKQNKFTYLKEGEVLFHFPFP